MPPFEEDFAARRRRDAQAPHGVRIELDAEPGPSGTWM